ncbi:MFS transporter [Deinococcus peraridilitoris]|uniref:Major Facilitator Superfamily transporter n=1 Tax=Deinococcus peraridilitoris (strain DSM 19664 / LMG 22246 / CIP 109416 / KR-200) TaxID=937777 RepID=K9ZY96_DEIPD|nr:MFS transporter [Deinococcus peraridilitoris]AFZ65912.1 Major Facilitator Superfamily transporter [Deinococcus peraridilitoris DSM 19664]
MSVRKPERREEKQSWRFNRQAWFFLLGSFGFGLAQAQLFLFLNFYLGALGLGASWQGFINALPALALVVSGLPAAALARRISYARTLQLGALLSTLGFFTLASADGAVLAVAGTFLQGVGAAFLVVAGAPFMTNNSTERQRVSLFSVQMALMTGAGFLGNIVGGRVPEWYASFTGSEARDLDSIRMALLAGGVFQLISLLPLAFLRPSGKPRPPGRTLAVKAKGTMFRLVLPNLLVGLGAGATIPFLNIFIEGKFNVSYASLGSLFAWTSLATAVAVLIQPWLVQRFGRLRAILFVQTASLPFLVILGFAPSLWMVTVALFTRGALMNAASPVYSANAMDRLPEEDRGVYSAVNTIVWDLGWAISSLASGFVRSALPFHSAFQVLFGITLTMYALSVVAIYFLQYRRWGGGAPDAGALKVSSE